MVCCRLIAFSSSAIAGWLWRLSIQETKAVIRLIAHMRLSVIVFTIYTFCLAPCHICQSLLPIIYTSITQLQESSIITHSSWGVEIGSYWESPIFPDILWVYYLLIRRLPCGFGSYDSLADVFLRRGWHSPVEAYGWETVWGYNISKNFNGEKGIVFCMVTLSP